MTKEIEEYIGKYPEETVRLFMQLRDAALSAAGIPVEEKLWAKLPSYYCNEKFVRIIPFKDHINIEAEGFAGHKSEFEGFRFTPKGMLQIRIDQVIPADALKAVFTDTFM